MLPLKTAMLLSAGLGSRLRPLTLDCPKPLLPVQNKPLIDWHLQRLAKFGIERVVLNVGYLGEQIMQHVQNGADYGLHVSYSIEDNGPLGVLPGLIQAKPLLGNEPFLLVSADTWFESDLFREFKQASTTHFVMVNNSRNSDGDFSIDSSGYLSDAGKQQTYSGVASINASDLPDIAMPFSDFMRALACEKKATASIYKGHYFNVSTPTCLKALNAFLSEHVPT